MAPVGGGGGDDGWGVGDDEEEGHQQQKQRRTRWRSVGVEEWKKRWWSGVADPDWQVM